MSAILKKPLLTFIYKKVFFTLLGQPLNSLLFFSLPYHNILLRHRNTNCAYDGGIAAWFLNISSSSHRISQSYGRGIYIKPINNEKRSISSVFHEKIDLFFCLLNGVMCVCSHILCPTSFYLSVFANVSPPFISKPD